MYFRATTVVMAAEPPVRRAPHRGRPAFRTRV